MFHFISNRTKIKTHCNQGVLFSYCNKKNELKVHKNLLLAPFWIVKAIASFVHKNKLSSDARIAMEQLLDTKEVRRKNIRVTSGVGEVYNLREIFEDLNHMFFDNTIDSNICWFGRERRKRNVSRVVLGSFHKHDNLIRIHKSLDRVEVPKFYIEYVVYHEMLHSVVHPGVSRTGRNIYHGTDFKNKERAFPYYQKAMDWEKQNRKILLGRR